MMKQGLLREMPAQYQSKAGFDFKVDNNETYLIHFPVVQHSRIRFIDRFQFYFPLRGVESGHFIVNQGWKKLQFIYLYDLVICGYSKLHPDCTTEEFELFRDQFRDELLNEFLAIEVLPTGTVKGKLWNTTKSNGQYCLSLVLVCTMK